jgi:hypothetical protein
MFTIGLCAGSHIGVGHADRLKDAGADLTVASFDEIVQYLRSVVNEPAPEGH